MNAPDTTLDSRFSGPSATPSTWDETRQVLERAQLSWICTVRADGRPHLAFAKGRFGQTRHSFA